MECSHKSVSWSRTQSAGYVKRGAHSNHGDADQHVENLIRKKLGGDWENGHANLNGNRDNDQIRDGSKTRTFTQGDPKEKNDGADQKGGSSDRERSMERDTLS